MANLTTQQMLTEAREQYHLLQTGNKARVLVDQNGERVEFAAIDAAKLLQYIQALEQTLGGATRLAPARVTL